MKKTLALVVAVMMLITVLLTGCAPKAPAETAAPTEAPKRDVFRYGYWVVQGQYDPFKVMGTADFVATGSIFDALVIYEESKGILPSIAESWTISPDGMVYTFKLRTDVKFHNGDLLTPADVKFSYEQMMATSSMLQQYVMNIDKVELEGTDSVKVTLKSPSAVFLKQASYILVAPEKVVKEAGDQWGVSVVVGSGPYKFKEYVEGQVIKLERNDDYFRGPAPIKNIEIVALPDAATALAALEKGEIDYTPNIMATDESIIAANKDLKLYKFPTTQLLLMCFNTKTAPFNNKLVRQAFSYAMDSEGAAMVERNGLGSVPTNFALPEGVVGYTTEPEAQPYGLNLEKAKQMLVDAGFDFKQEIPVYAISGYGDKMVESYVNNLLSIGVNAKYVAKTGAEYPVMQPGAPYGIGFFAATNSLFDPIAIGNWFGSTGPGNFYNYSNPEVDKLLAEAKQTLDETARGNLYNQAVKMVREDAVIIPAFWEIALEAGRSDVQGFEPQAHDGRMVFYNIHY